MAMKMNGGEIVTVGKFDTTRHGDAGCGREKKHGRGPDLSEKRGISCVSQTIRNFAPYEDFEMSA